VELAGVDHAWVHVLSQVLGFLQAVKLPELHRNRWEGEEEEEERRREERAGQMEDRERERVRGKRNEMERT